MALAISTEMGAPLWFSHVGQVGATAMALDAFLTAAADYPWEERRAGSFGSPVVVRREPAGVVGVARRAPGGIGRPRPSAIGRRPSAIDRRTLA